MLRIRALAGIVLVTLFTACVAGDPEDAREGESSLGAAEGIAARPLPASVAAAIKDATTRGPARRASPVDARRGTPIHEPGGREVALYEVDLAPGWAVVTASQPAHVLELGTSGEGPVARLLRSASGVERVVRLDTALYVGTDAAGRAVAQSTRSIARVGRSRSSARLVPVTADEAIQQWPSARAELERARLERSSDSTPRWWWDSDAPERSCVAPGDVPKYSQIPPGEGPNDTGCYSGCGPTAWAMLFGWASKRAAQSPPDAAYAGLFRSGDEALGPIVVAPDGMDAAAVGLSWTLREELSTFCLTDQGATTPWSMQRASSFVAARAPGVGVDVDYSTLMMMSAGLRDSAIEAICDGRPAIVGIGSLFTADMHYPVAKGYENGMFQLEMGWGGGGDGWYETGTWFMGTIRR